MEATGQKAAEAAVWQRIQGRSLLLFLCFQVLYGVCVFPFFSLVGDAADYANLISHGIFHVQTTHLGFYLAYFPFAVLNRRLIGIDPDLFLNLVTTTLAALVVPTIDCILRELLGGDASRRDAAALHGAVIYGLSGLVWYHAEFAEVQALMMLGACLAFLLFLRGRVVAAGAALGLSVLVSQAIAPCGAWFLTAALTRRIPIRALLRFASAFSATLLGVVLPFYEDFLWGARGLFSVHGYYPAAGIAKTVGSLLYTLIESFWPLLPLGLIALRSVRTERELLWLSVATLLPALYLGARLVQSDYGVVWLPLFPPAAAWLGIGLHAFLRRCDRRWQSVGATTVATVFLLTTLYSYVLPKRRGWQQAFTCLERIHAVTAQGHVITDPYVGFNYAHTYWPEHANAWEAPWSMLASARAREVLSSGEQHLFVLDYVPPSHFLRRLLLATPPITWILSREQRTGYLEDLEATSREFRQAVPERPLRELWTCDGFALWEVGRAERGGSAVDEAPAAR